MADSTSDDGDRPRPRARRSSGKAAAHKDSVQARRTAAGLSYNEARSALDLILAELQSSTLNVEEMAALHRRAQAYAQRCEQILDEVEQEILIWDPSADADTDPVPDTP
ncbi:exodeoxyribonuclease VII small subunit [Cyanobium sp. PCC 7001]|uniref:exodeoxyribonuclease VII small subunit n=1 Tax=Cyanobium sp. PCC 7001 TaxID=180281 RepID=UPI00030657B5|nr:exodeoxyribonuclease VII small subunit [Cyanobium sp. PCC 7001]